MDLNTNKLFFNISCLILVLLFFFPVINPVLAKSPWTLSKKEQRLEGTIVDISNKEIVLETSQGIINLSFISHPIAAIKGMKSGYLVSPKDFSKGLHVEIYINSDNKIRAIKNTIKGIDLPPGIPLGNWGHDISLSPDEKHYLLFKQNEGLILCNITDPEKEVFLSINPTAAWSHDGKQIAYIDNQNNLLIYNITSNTRKKISYSKNSNNTVRHISHLAWSPDNMNILCAFLQDYPNQCSDLFQINVIDVNGNLKAKSVIACLASIFWYNDSQIIYNKYDDLDELSGIINLWNIFDDTTCLLLPNINREYRNLAINVETKTLAYTLKKGLGENLILFDIAKGKKNIVKFLPFPIYNLQWSKNNQLYFGEELNYIIDKLDENFNLIQVSEGYLPQCGAQNNLLYFLSEPINEPLQVYLK